MDPLTTGLFHEARSVIRAFDSINSSISLGESPGLVGRSGSGKTTTGKHLVRLIDPTDGEIVTRMDSSQAEVARLRGRR